MAKNQYKNAILAAGALISVTVLMLTLFNFIFGTAFSFASLREGQLLSGDVNIGVNVSGAVHFVELWIDGKEYSAQNTGTSGSNRYATFGIPTSGFVNGSHTIELRLGHTVYDRRHIIFQNAKHPG